MDNPEVFYLFIVPAFSDGSVQGYMPRGRNVGFVTTPTARVIAHELGHGLAGLRHIQDQQPASAQNLMDYGSGSYLTHAQWQRIQHPPLVLNWFDDLAASQLLANSVVLSLDELVSGADGSITVRYGAESKSYTFTPKRGVTIRKLSTGKFLLSTTNPEDKQWEGEYAAYFLERDRDAFVGFYNLTMSGICTPTLYNRVQIRLCQERWLPEEVYNQHVTEPYVIAKSANRRERNRENTGLHHDMMSCDMTDDQIIALNPLTVLELSRTEEELVADWKLMASPMSIGNLFSVSMEMIDKFIASTGGTFSSPKLDEAAANHQSTNTFFDRLNAELKIELANNSDFVRIKGTLKNTLIDIPTPGTNIKRPDIPSPQWKEWFTGLGIMINDTWGYDATVTNFAVNESKRSYSVTFEVDVFDHFGLDSLDIDPFEKTGFAVLSGFRSWFVLQHSTRFCKKPFITIVRLKRTIYGTY